MPGIIDSERVITESMADAAQRVLEGMKAEVLSLMFCHLQV